jgi:hypothetical protein
VSHPTSETPLSARYSACLPAEAWPVVQEAASCGAGLPTLVPSVADQDAVPGLDPAVLGLPLSNAVDAQKAVRAEVGSIHGRGAANEAVERHVVHAVVRGTAPNKVQRGVQVGAGVLAQGQAGVSGDVPVLVGLVEGPAEAGVRGPGGDVLFQGVGKVHPAKPPQVFYELRQISPVVCRRHYYFGL